MQFPTFGEIGRNIAADSLKLQADKSGFWDGAATLLLFLIFLSLSYLGALAQKNLDEQSLIGKMLKEVLSDAASELRARIGIIRRTS